MNIYLVSSTNKLSTTARHIRKILRKMGHNILTGNPSIKIQKADILVAEIQKDSLCIGYLAANFLNAKKPSLILHPKTLKIDGFTPANLDNAFQFITIKPYSSPSQIEKIIKNYLDNLKISSRRFNFFIPTDIDDYLSWIPYSKQKPRAEFVRNLIRETMKKDEEYKTYKDKK